MRILLARHGESVSNAHPDAVTLPEGEGDHLTDLGLEQAHALGRSLKQSGVTDLITSPMGRARETAAAVSDELGLAVEVNPGIHELREASAYGTLSPEEQKLRRWSERMAAHPDDPDHSEGGEESFNQVRDRVRSFRAELIERDPDRLPLAVTHGIFLRFFLIDILLGDEFGPGSVGRLWNLRTSNCGLCLFEYGERYHRADPERPGWVCSMWMARPWALP